MRVWRPVCQSKLSVRRRILVSLARRERSSTNTMSSDARGLCMLATRCFALSAVTAGRRRGEDKLDGLVIVAVPDRLVAVD
eukprot:260969-Prorocentrum_minimum.AAC.1